MPDVSSAIAAELGLRPSQVANTVQLLEAGNTVPFITRYRKEMTGGFNEDQIRAVEQQMAHHKTLQERKDTVLEQIRSQGKLTPELERQISQADKLKVVEDLYLPYKQKKRTLATVAREKGLEPLALEIWAQAIDDAALESKVPQCLDPAKGLGDRQDVLDGLRHILAEMIAEEPQLRQEVREVFRGVLNTGPTPQEAEKQENSEYYNYFDFAQAAKELPPHRILAINRGEKEKALRVHIDVAEGEILQKMAAKIVRTGQPAVRQLLLDAIDDGYRRLLYPSLCREMRSDLTEKAQSHAIHVFAENLKRLLLMPPVRGRRILGIDPGLRTGCKLAVIDALGKLLDTDVIYPHPPQSQKKEAAATVLAKIQKYRVNLIAIGNGTAHRETEELVSEIIAGNQLGIEYTIVSEAGASVYSASKEAQQEFPQLDASYRGTISIARRLQDPLSELVKIDPKSIGVGLYQHDVDQKELSRMVDTVVESCVNYVGVDLNTASVSLLQYVSGLNSLKARRIYEWRQENGSFNGRQDLLKVKGIGSDTFLQAAGFLKIPDGANPLDNTQIHPESYDKTGLLLGKVGIGAAEIVDPAARSAIYSRLDALDLEQVAGEIGAGIPTLRDIVENLKKPGRDPREELPRPAFRRGILRLEDLQVGMELQGTVRNVVDFGAFVDIGVKEDGLVHVSEMADRYVKNPLDVIAVGDIVNVTVIGIDEKRRRIALSLRSKGDPGAKARKQPQQGEGPGQSPPRRRAPKAPDSGKAPGKPQGQVPKNGPGKPSYGQDWKDALKKISRKDGN